MPSPVPTLNHQYHLEAGIHGNKHPSPADKFWNFVLLRTFTNQFTKNGVGFKPFLEQIGGVHIVIMSHLVAHGNFGLPHTSTHLNQFGQSRNSKHQIWEGYHCLPRVCTKMMYGTCGRIVERKTKYGQRYDITLKVVSLFGKIPLVASYLLICWNPMNVP